MTKKFFLLGMIVLCLLLKHAEADSQNFLIKPTEVIWEEEDENGQFRIDTYTVRSEQLLRTPREKLYQVLVDFENYDKWMPHFRATQKPDDQHLNFVFQTDVGEYTLTLKTEFPRRNMNGYYHWIRLTTENEFHYSSLKAMEHHFYLYRVENMARGGILDPNHTLLEVVNHTKVGGILRGLPESQMREVLLNVTNDMFHNLQLYLNTIEDQE